MKTISRREFTRAFTLIEVLIVLFVILFLALLLLPGGTFIPRKQLAIEVMCRSNLRQDALGLMMWGQDHKNALPWQFPAEKGGTMGLTGADVSSQFSVLSNYIREPRVFLCPADKGSRPPEEWAKLAGWNISYFINLDSARMAQTNTFHSILSGDWNLQVDESPVPSGRPITLGTQTNLAWTRKMHVIQGRSLGNFSFMDGHVERIRQENLKAAINTQDSASRFLFP